MNCEYVSPLCEVYEVNNSAMLDVSYTPSSTETLNEETFDWSSSAKALNMNDDSDNEE